ncbi:MAG TPA: TlpA disulfide reductase family protein [Chitinophaga sp.]|uniref:TlpA disulfide reductase family protein n=1 Tax=Chitinophaga sp. TaxID=1869181 RepID=UPI002F95392A
MLKPAILLAASLLPLALRAQGGYTISGTIPALSAPVKAYLLLVQNGAFRESDSADIKNGTFQFKGSVDEPQQAIVSVVRQGVAGPKASGDYVAFFLENSAISLTATDSIKRAKVDGSKADEESKALEAATSPLTDIIIKLNDEFEGKPRDDAWKKTSDSVARLIARIKAIQTGFVESHLNSYMGLYTYHYFVLGQKFKPAEAEPLFHRFSPQLQSSALGKRTFEKIESTKKGQAGVKVTDFTQTDMNGKPFTLSSLRGKYVLVDFWASWCTPCRAENPNLVKAYQQLKGKNFEVVSVSLDESKAAWVWAVKKDGLPWIQVCDLKGFKNEVAVMYGVNAVPQNFLVDPNGMIIARDLRGEGLTEKLSALVK